VTDPEDPAPTIRRLRAELQRACEDAEDLRERLPRAFEEIGALRAKGPAARERSGDGLYREARLKPDVRRRFTRTGVLAVLLLSFLPAGAAGQVFLASRPDPGFTLGPLYVRALVAPELGTLSVDILWSLGVPTGRSMAKVIEGDLFLLWPSAVLPTPDLGPPDRELIRYVEQRGFVSIEEGRLELSARDVTGSSDRADEKIPGGAPFTTFVRRGGGLGLTAPATYVRIPWHPKMQDPAWMMRLHMQTKGLIKPKSATWAERAFWGPRQRLVVSFLDVSPLGIFPLYFENRARVVRLGEEPTQIRIDFASADHLKIDEIAPASSRRQLSETEDNTDVVTLPLDQAEGLRPQALTVQFGYFSKLQSWAPILIPFAFFALGNLAAPIVREIGLRLARVIRARVHIGSFARPATKTNTGVLLSAETLARIRPGETRGEELLGFCGPSDEEQEQLGAPNTRTLVYRRRQLVPRRKRSWGWIATIDHWEMEQQDVEVTVDGDVVRDVQARVRRTRLTHPDA
jgi:hypothetical protein